MSPVRILLVNLVVIRARAGLEQLPRCSRTRMEAFGQTRRLTLALDREWAIIPNIGIGVINITIQEQFLYLALKFENLPILSILM